MKEDITTMVRQEERMSTMTTKVFVVSLPRTGTKSMCQMLKDLGYDVKHVPGPYLPAFSKKHDALADTPVFSHSSVKFLLEEYPDAKFIYLEKNPEDWYESMVKVKLARNYNNMLSQDYETLSLHSKADVDSLSEVLNGKELTEETFEEAFTSHKKFILETIPQGQLLLYGFSMGWFPLCKFLEKPVPADKDVPHLNKNTMFDKLT